MKTPFSCAFRLAVILLVMTWTVPRPTSAEGAEYTTQNDHIGIDSPELTLGNRQIDYEAARQFWSFRPLVRPDVPQAPHEWVRNSVDRFIFARHRDPEAQLSTEASSTALVRRAHFDLIGLPPSLDDIQTFGQRNLDAEYEQLVDRLLDSPRYGERWARYWLDVARFAESSGFEMDHDRPAAWRYRDFVIKALNEDMSYDEFVRLQLAGDHLRPNDSDAAIATGFVVAGVENLIQTRKDFIPQRYDKIDDMLSTVGTGLLALSLGCARCHDHKYDPFAQHEYYQLAASFASTVSAVKEFRLKDSDDTDKSYVATESPNGRIRMVTVTERSFKDLPSIPAVVHFLVRGDTNNQREAMEVGFPGVLVRAFGQFDITRWTASSDESGAEVPGRVALARWISDTQHGAGDLLARVIVNRLWHHHFGRGIVSTPSDFGTRGERPTHPKLLDWLATELIRNQWRLKAIHKLIMMSATYRQTSRAFDSEFATDGGELSALETFPVLQREPRRLDAEAIRDNLLAVSGRLDTTMYGPGTLDQNHPRRSVYLTLKRSQLIPVLQLFDAPDTLQGIGRRQTTTTAPQGLMMLNSPFVDACVSAFARRLDAMESKSAAEYIRNGFLLAVGRKPSTSEVDQSKELFDNTMESRRAFCQMLFCLNEFIYVE